MQEKSRIVPSAISVSQANPARNRIDLEPDQEELLAYMVESARAAPRAEQEFNLVGNGNHLAGPGGERAILADDVFALEEEGLLKATQLNYYYGNSYLLTRLGYQYYERLQQRAGGQVERVE